MQKLTSRQSEVLANIHQYIEQHGFPPTIVELATTLNIRPNAVRDHLRALARKGVIELTPATSRGIRLRDIALDDAFIRLPIVGRVAAGSPILAQQHIETYHQVDATLFKPRADYLLRVCGDSMQNAGILDGDLLAVHKTKQVENRQIVVARIDDEVTVKRFKQVAHMAYLLPENDDFNPIEIDLRNEQLNIEGLGVGVIRKCTYLNVDCSRNRFSSSHD